jgi:hypothetical protein
VSTTETPPQAFGFADVQQSVSPVPDCIDARNSETSFRLSRINLVVGNLIAIRPNCDRRTRGIAIRSQLILPVKSAMPAAGYAYAKQ